MAAQDKHTKAQVELKTFKVLPGKALTPLPLHPPAPPAGHSHCPKQLKESGPAALVGADGSAGGSLGSRGGPC